MFWLTGILALVLVCSVAVTQIQNKHKYKAPLKDTLAIAGQDEDSVEIVGTPTDEDPWKEVEKLVAAYYDHTGMLYKGTLKVIDDNGEQEKVLEEHPFQYSIFNNSFHYRLAHMEMVSKKNFLLSVDHENKTVMLAPNASMQKTNKTFDIRAFKKVMEKGKARALVTRLGEEKVLTIDHIGDPDIQGYRIYYSPLNYRVHKMLIGMVRLNPLEEAPEIEEEGITEYYYYLEVLYSQIEALGMKEKDFHPEQKFIALKNGQPSLTAEFKDYQFLNGDGK